MADADESMAARFATTLIQRGYDNVFVLSGGLRVAKIKFPEQLVTPPQHDVDDEDLFDEQIGEERVRKKCFEKFVLICFLNLYVVFEKLVCSRTFFREIVILKTFFLRSESGLEFLLKIPAL